MAEYETICKELALATKKLEEAQDQLDQLDVLKAKEAQLRKDVIKYTARVEDLTTQAEGVVKEGEFMQKPVQVAPLAAKVEEARIELDKDPAKVRQNRMRAINKKLQGIEKLKAKDGPLDEEAAKKVKTEPALRKKLAALERGEDPDSDAEEEPQGGVELPSDPAERQKKIKALQKKLREVEALKQKGGMLDAQAKIKRDSEQHLIQELSALESGASVFVLDEAALFAAHKFELEKQVKKLQKKITQIAELKAKPSLDEDAQAKVDGEKDTKKELKDLEADVAKMNEVERKRVADRLGWEAEKKGKKNGKK